MKILIMQFILVTASTFFVIGMLLVNSFNAIPLTQSTESVKQNSIETPKEVDEKHMVSLFNDIKIEGVKQSEFKIYPSFGIKSLSADEINETIIKDELDL